MDLFIHALKQYALLGIVCIAFWGIGSAVLVRLTSDILPDRWLAAALSTTVGMGIYIVVLQLMGSFGLLRRGAVYLALVSGLLLAARSAHTCITSALSSGASRRWLTPPNPWAVLTVLLAATMAFRPLTVPLAWDELMYHLPHARQWAQSGSLTVNAWLRYAWFPYNFDLLYAAALTMRNDTFTHLLHALAGWLTLLMIYRLCVLHVNACVAFVASGLWIYVSRWFFNTAYIELGLTLFVFASCITFYQWLNRVEDEGWLLIACFLFGVAAGSKYQALTFLPLFFAGVVWQRPRPALLLKAALFLLIPCVYWYARNYLLTGDPVNPLGGRFFGYSDWDAGDMDYQLLDVKRISNWPAYVLWPALIAPIFLIFRKNRALSLTALTCAYAAVVWYLTSRYDRYLMPAFPLIAILSAYSMGSAFELIAKAAPRLLDKYHLFFRVLIFSALTFGLIFTAIEEYEQHHKIIATDSASREEILHRVVPEMGVLTYLKKNPQGKIYQIGLEGVIYHAPNPIWGDHFGFWRYRDWVLPGPESLAKKLKSGGFSVLVMDVGTSKRLENRIHFKQYFQEIASSPGAIAYRIEVSESNKP